MIGPPLSLFSAAPFSLSSSLMLETSTASNVLLSTWARLGVRMVLLSV
jgi:hypothetical protein